MNLKKYLSECLGTCLLLIFGAGSVVNNSISNGRLGLLGISLSFGIIVICLIYILGPISGCHINPAVSLALWLDKKISGKDTVFYIISQIIGAFIGVMLLKLTFPESVTFGETLPAFGIASAFAAELVMTFALMLTILGVISHKNSGVGSLGGLIIGLYVTGAILVAGPISGAGINPARSIAPMIFTGNFAELWIYILAPCLGAMGSVYVFRYLGKN